MGWENVEAGGLEFDKSPECKSENIPDRFIKNGISDLVRLEVAGGNMNIKSINIAEVNLPHTGKLEYYLGKEIVSLNQDILSFIISCNCNLKYIEHPSIKELLQEAKSENCEILRITLVK